MSLKERIRRRMEQAEFTEKINAIDYRGHSRAYHRFFEGYTELKEPRRNRKGSRINRIYTGTYYHRELSRSKDILHRVLYAFFVFAAAVLFVVSAMMKTTVNSVWYAAAAQACSIPFLLWSILAVFNYIFGKQDMTVYEHKSASIALKRATMAAAIFLAAAGSAGMFLFFTADGSNKNLVCAVRYLIAACFAGGTSVLEHTVKYSKKLSENCGKINGVQIS